MWNSFFFLGSEVKFPLEVGPHVPVYQAMLRKDLYKFPVDLGGGKPTRQDWEEGMRAVKNKPLFLGSWGLCKPVVF